MSLSPLDWRPRRHLHVVRLARPHRQKKKAFFEECAKPLLSFDMTLPLQFTAVVVGACEENPRGYHPGGQNCLPPS